MKIFHFPSKSSPTAPPHQTTVHDDGRVTCTCKAGMTNKVCWHLQAARLKATPIVSEEDRRLILRLLDDGNEAGAMEAAHDLFPSMTPKETEDFINHLANSL